MRFEFILLTIFCTFFMLTLPVIAGANEVSWTSEQYTAYAWNGMSSQTNYGVSAVAHVGGPISSTLFVVGAAVLGFRRFRKNINLRGIK